MPARSTRSTRKPRTGPSPGSATPPGTGDFEKLGVFYLGRPYNLKDKKAAEGLILYDSKDLVTHAVCVGMTGSGKTGLCICLLEEAAIDGIPAIVIDPKGDLTNLMLTFPRLQAQDFQPWVNEDDARRQGVPVEEYARQQADLWTQGLREWGQDGARVQRLRDAAEFAIYTPGSTAGIPVSILSSFAAPPPSTREDAEAFSERVGTTATSLLTLLGIEADPVRSREHILISTVLGVAWRAGQDLDLTALIQGIQTPPVSRIGVVDLESFFPSDDRFALAMRLNNLLAAPGFDLWMRGEPMDVGRFLYSAQGKPRVSIFSIAHLGDAERMSFVALLLNQVLGWMRGQSGTTSLRAILYMDEIFGFFPPVANPPSKAPLLTLLKQARAFGLGVVLATQNPVDLDYKGLSNTGTWFLGRLQTERDKARVLDGLEGVAAGTGMRFDRSEMDTLLAGLGKRIFLMHNVHDDGPEVFATRWAMSYLRGPLTREGIKRLMEPVKAAMPATSTPAAPSPAPPTPIGPDAAVSVPAEPATAPGGRTTRAPVGAFARPVLPPDIPQYFVPFRTPPSPGAGARYEPMVFGAAQIQFLDTKLGVD
ncbi:MAG: ATP-binding protein, partial [Armatimonadota bacterium]